MSSASKYPKVFYTSDPKCKTKIAVPHYYDREHWSYIKNARVLETIKQIPGLKIVQEKGAQDLDIYVIGTSYHFYFRSHGRFDWYETLEEKEDGLMEAHYMISFEEVLEKLPEHLQEKFLYHLDIFK